MTPVALCQSLVLANENKNETDAAFTQKSITRSVQVTILRSVKQRSRNLGYFYISHKTHNELRCFSECPENISSGNFVQSGSSDEFCNADVDGNKNFLRKRLHLK